MIELIDVGKYYFTEAGRHYVFRNVSMVLPPDRSIGIMGPNGAGKSTFLRLISGADIPSEGSVIRTGRISPPMGLTPGLQGSLTAAENARFAGRIYGLDRDEINDMIEYVRETADIGKFFDQPVYMYSAGMKQRVAFAINMSMNFDYYLFDEINAGGDKEFRRMAKDKVLDRLRTSKFIMTSHNTRELLEFCQSGIVIRDGELTYFDDINEAVEFYGDTDGEERGALMQKLERRKAREERRRLRDAGGEVPALAAPEETPAEEAETPQEPDREERARRRAERRSRSAAEVQDSAAEAGEIRLLAAPSVPAAMAVAEPLPAAEPQSGTPPEQPVEPPAEVDADAERELRRQQREERRRARAARAGPAEEVLAVAAVPAEPGVLQAESAGSGPAEVAIESDRQADAAAIGDKRRQRREERLRLRAEAAGTDAAVPSPAAPETAEASGPPAGTGIAASEVEADPPADDLESVRAARRAAAEERRRQRQAERDRSTAENAASSGSGPAGGDGQPEALSRAEARTGRRGAKHRRRRAVPDEAASGPADDVPNTESGNAGAADQAAEAPVHGAAQAGEAGVGPVPGTAEEQIAAPASAAVPPLPHCGTPETGQAEAGGGLSDADRKLLFLRLLMRQDRAQAKASRAARLLLQHLDAPTDETAQTRSGRAMLVRAAQDIAAAEAAAARALLDQALSGGIATGEQIELVSAFHSQFGAPRRISGRPDNTGTEPT